MASHQTQRQMIIHNENLGIPHKKALANDKPKSTKTAAKKGIPLGSRKALNDITNKSTIRPEASSRKKNLPKEEIDVAGEAFLHDHKKCIDLTKTTFGPHFVLDTILPGHDSVFPYEDKGSTKAKSDLHSPHRILGSVELPMSDFSDWLKGSAQMDSPPGSPIHWDSLSSPWQFKPVDFVLKLETDV